MSPRRVGALFFLGSFLIQLAWISAVPPYRGIDEYDHVYRAAAVAHGDWGIDHSPASRGRGVLLAVPPRIVTDGTEICEAFEYTGHDNCHPVGRATDDLVYVASAAMYNPVFYWLIGTPALLSDGAGAVYLMRLAASLLCASLVALAAGTLAAWSRSVWSLIGLSLALTPVCLFSTAMPAPNGLEMVSALCVYVGLFGLGRSDDSTSRLCLATSIVGLVVLLPLRILSPLWAALIVATALLVVGLRRSVIAARRHPALVITGIAAVTLSSAYALWWTWITVGPTPGLETASSSGDLPGNPWSMAGRALPLWIFQSIAAFPTRTEPAPSIVYAVSLLALVVFLCRSALRAGARARLGMATCALVSLALPFVFTVATYAQAGPIWQGRYGLPYSFGVVLIAALAVNTLPASHRLRIGVPVAMAAFLAIAMTVSVVAVQLRQIKISPLSEDPRWLMAPTWLVAILTLAGIAMFVITWRQSCSRSYEHLAASPS